MRFSPGIWPVLGLVVALAGGAIAWSAVLPVPVPRVAEAGQAREDATDEVTTIAAAPVALDTLPEVLLQLLPRLPEADATRLRRRATRWQTWSPEARAAFAERVAAWQALPPAERAARREAWQALQALPAEQRARVLDMARAYAHKPATEQEARRQRFAALDADVRRGWRLGPALGADYAVLHPLLAQVPAEQHAPLLAILQSMTSAQRVQLGVLAQRTPPQDRDILRLDLIATPAARRQHWLWEQLER